jgi:outer membrane protein TolC
MTRLSAVTRLAGLLLFTFAASSTARATGLTLAETERLALEHAPWLQHHRTNVEAAAERAGYEGRLPDPQLTLGVVNVPTDSWRLDREDMTMVNVGVRQQFPPGDTLKLRAQRAEKELTREQARLEIERRNLLRQVRFTWLELALQERSQRLLAAQRIVQQRQLDAAEGRHRAAQDTPQVVLRARQALARIDERAATLGAQSERLRSQLTRWIGEAVHEPLPPGAPTLPPVPEPFDVTQHPEWLAMNAGVEAARAEVDMARQEYKPGFMVDVSYGARRAMPDGTPRSDLVTAFVTFDMPIFRRQRQDRRLAEKQTMEAAARYETEDKRRELETMYASARAEHAALAVRVGIFTDTLLPAIDAESQITSTGFARDLTERRDAQMKALDARLDLARLRTDLAKSHTDLLYLAGEPQP